MHGETVTFSAPEMALDDGEVEEVLLDATRATELNTKARGWPAVIGLAAFAGTANVAASDLALAEELYEYLADELFDRAALSVQNALTKIVSLPPLAVEELAGLVGGADVVEDVLESGLAYQETGRVVIHPLARALLVTKLLERHDGAALPERRREGLLTPASTMMPSA